MCYFWDPFKYRLCDRSTCQLKSYTDREKKINININNQYQYQCQCLQHSGDCGTGHRDDRHDDRRSRWQHACYHR